MKNISVEPVVPSIRDYDYEVVCGSVDAAELPDYFIIPDGKVGVIKDQVVNGIEILACAAEAASCFAQYFHKEDTGEDIEFSEAWFYATGREDWQTGKGLNVPTLFEKWRKIGALPKTYLNKLMEMPAMKEVVDAAPGLKEIAKNHKLGGSVTLNYANSEKKENAIRSALVKYRYGLFAVSNSYFGGPHAIIIVGYNFKDPKNKKYIIQNSYGEDYGDKGIAEVPISAINSAYLLTYNPIKLPFTDLDDNWAKEDIKNVYLSGLMKGVSDTEFDPKGNVIREQLAAVLNRQNKSIVYMIETAVNIVRKEMELMENRITKKR